jgi:hypothetical protein
MRLFIPDLHVSSLRVVPKLPPTSSKVSTPPEAFGRISTPSESNKAELQSEPIQHKLFNNSASLKIATSKFAMHLENSQRQDLFRQIDSLLALENWADDSSLIDEMSFFTFLRFLTEKKKVRRMGLSVSSAGNIMGTWFAERPSRLTIEFYPSDQVKLLASSFQPTGVRIAIAFEGPLALIDDYLSPIQAIQWYREAARP